MLTLLGNLESGNVHKIQMMLAYLNLRFARVDVAQTRDEPRRPEFLALNPMGKVPVVVLDGGDVLAESGAVLYWFGRDTPLWPRDSLAQTEVLRWMFFEQYSHEPYIAVARNIITYLKHRITNATSESINAKIQWVKYTARGFRNKQNFINAIYFHCGGLDLAPAATK